MRQRHTRGTKQMAAAMAAIQTKTAGLRRCERKKGSKLGEFVRNFSHYVRLAVSPEFRLRPLLSALREDQHALSAGRCRRSSDSGLC